ncbi:MAG: RuBisCO chaperone RbcX [Elainellaceae cyanobacterium]
MDLKQIAKDTTKTLISYLTYQAVRTVVSQLRETNPPLSIWLNQFSSAGKIQDGEAYLQDLVQVNQQLAFRIMTVRAHLAEEIVDFLPEMVKSGVQEANIDHRRRYLERITQLNLSEAVPRSDSMSEQTDLTSDSPESDSDSETHSN